MACEGGDGDRGVGEGGRLRVQDAIHADDWNDLRVIARGNTLIHERDD
jgi:hypothetical protein